MQFTILVAAFALASSAFARPHGCQNQQSAELLVSRYSAMRAGKSSDLGNQTVTAMTILTANYQEFSDSVLALEGANASAFGGPTVSSRADYIAGAPYRGSISVINDLGVYVAGCGKVLWQWEFPYIGDSEYPIKGFSLFTTNKHGLLVKTEFEFNSLSWGIDESEAELIPEGSEPTSSSAVASATATPTSSVVATVAQATASGSAEEAK